MEILVEIFDDGKNPVTCARDFTKDDSICQFIWAHGLSGKYKCGLFDNFLKRDKSGRRGFLVPCKKCLEARRESNN